jgi:hypothetical protein
MSNKSATVGADATNRSDGTKRYCTETRDNRNDIVVGLKRHAWPTHWSGLVLVVKTAPYRVGGVRDGN